MENRRKIALALMTANARKGYPKTLGEGLAAIGDTIGDVATMRQLMAREAGFQRQIGTDTAPSTASTAPVVRQKPADDTAPDEQVPAPERPAQPPPPEPPPPPPPPQQAAPTVRTIPVMPGPQPQPSSNLQIPTNMPRAGQSYDPVTGNVISPGAGENWTPGGPRSEVAPLTGVGAAGPSRADIAAAGVNFPVDPRNAIAALMLQRQTAMAGPQQNPTLAAQGPQSMPSETRPPGGQRPSVVSDINQAPDDIMLTPGAQLAQAGPPGGIRPVQPPPMPPVSQMPPSIPPPEAGSQPYTAPPSAGRVPIPPSAQTMLRLPPAPPMPGKSPAQIELEARYARILPLDPTSATGLKAQIDQLEQARQEAFKPLLEEWNAKRDMAVRDFEAERGRQRNLPQTNIELQAKELQLRNQIEDDQLRQRLGNVEPKDYAAMLAKSKVGVDNLASTADSIARARDLATKMYTGPLADTNTYLAKMMAQAGFPLNPKASGTEQFKNAMVSLMAQARPAIVGAGSQSEAELRLLQQATAADAKLTPETIRAALDAAERLNMRVALQHQRMVRRFAGDTDSDRRGTVYDTYGVPNMATVVPQVHVNTLFQNSTNPQALRDFDNAFHTPGLAQQVLMHRRHIAP
jgi:hypothetical protein